MTNLRPARRPLPAPRGAHSPNHNCTRSGVFKEVSAPMAGWEQQKLLCNQGSDYTLASLQDKVWTTTSEKWEGDPGSHAVGLGNPPSAGMLRGSFNSIPFKGGAEPLRVPWGSMRNKRACRQICQWTKSSATCLRRKSFPSFTFTRARAAVTLLSGGASPAWPQGISVTGLKALLWEIREVHPSRTRRHAGYLGVLPDKVTGWIRELPVIQFKAHVQ